MLQESISMMVYLNPNQTWSNISSIWKVSINRDHHTEKKIEVILITQLHTKKEVLTRW